MSRLPPVRWAISDGLVPYRAAEAFMQAEAGAIADGRAAEMIWLLEHPPLYSAGTSAKDADLVAPDRFPVYKTGRGGQYTYHGPGQRVAYVLLNLKARNPDVRAFVDDLETWILRTLASFNIRAASRPDRVGLWVPRKGFPDGGPEDKIAAIGVRLHRWVSFHGIALNVDPDLEHFSGIVPCGIRDHGVTSLYALGQPVLMSEVDSALRVAFESVFGATAPAAPPDLNAAARVPAEA